MFAALLCLVGPALAHFELVKPLAGFVAFGIGGLLGLVATATGTLALLSQRRENRDAALRGFVPALAVVAALLILASLGPALPLLAAHVGQDVAALGGLTESAPTASVADRAGSVRLRTPPEGVVVPALPRRVAAVKR